MNSIYYLFFTLWDLTKKQNDTNLDRVQSVQVLSLFSGPYLRAERRLENCFAVPNKLHCAHGNLVSRSSSSTRTVMRKGNLLTRITHRMGLALVGFVTLLPCLLAAGNSTGEEPYVFNVYDRVVVTNQAMGARCAVAADFDGDGRQDLVSASSNDNAVSWYRNEGNDENGHPVFSIKRQITWSSLGSRIVTVADINGDGIDDVVGASYYDSSLRWFENDGTGQFTPHVISTAVNEGQGVTVADIDNDGDNDIITASSGDNTIAVFKNIDHGKFCEIKEIVDDNAIGARTVVASDLNGDGWIDLASASKVRKS